MREMFNRKGGAAVSFGKPRRLGYVTIRGEFEENGKKRKKKEAGPGRGPGLPVLVKAVKVGNATDNEDSEDEQDDNMARQPRWLSKSDKERLKKEAKKRLRAERSLAKQKAELKQAYLKERETLKKRKKELSVKKDMIVKDQLEKARVLRREEEIRSMRKNTTKSSQVHNRAGGGADLIRASMQRMAAAKEELRKTHELRRLEERKEIRKLQKLASKER